MKKTLITLAVVMIAISSIAAPTFWSPHRRVVDIYRLDLAGAAPTSTQVQNNNLKAGDFVLDTSNGSAYMITDVTAPTYITFGSNSAVTAVMTPTTVTASSTVTTSGVRVDTPTALSVTNNAPITVSAGSYILNGIGQAANATNTVTVANGTAGTIVRFVVSRSSTNGVNFADSGNLYLNGACPLLADDVLTIYAASATNWVEVGRSDN